MFSYSDAIEIFNNEGWGDAQVQVLATYALIPIIHIYTAVCSSEIPHPQLPALRRWTGGPLGLAGWPV